MLHVDVHNACSMFKSMLHVRTCRYWMQMSMLNRDTGKDTDINTKTDTDTVTVTDKDIGIDMDKDAETDMDTAIA
jgi:hypothetical protein